MTVSRREALRIGAAAVPASALFQSSALADPTPNPMTAPVAGNDLPLACCLLIDGNKQLLLCNWAGELAHTDDVKAIARAEVEEHEAFRAALREIGYEYPAPAPPDRRGAGPLPPSPGESELIRINREAADQCVTSAKEVLGVKDAAGPRQFDRAFVGMQLHEHYGSLDKVRVFEGYASAAMRHVLRRSQSVIERHIAALEQFVHTFDGAPLRAAPNASDGRHAEVTPGSPTRCRVPGPSASTRRR